MSFKSPPLSLLLSVSPLCVCVSLCLCLYVSLCVYWILGLWYLVLAILSTFVRVCNILNILIYIVLYFSCHLVICGVSWSRWFWLWLALPANHLNSPVIPKEIEAVIKSLPTKKAQDQMGLVQNSVRVQRRNNTNISQTIPHNRNRTSTT